MHLIKLTRIALSSLLKNRTRSVLTMLGIIIGVAAVIVMVAIGQGAQETVRENIGALGTNVIMVFPGANMFGGVSRGAGTGNPLEMDDVEALREQSTLLAAVSPAAHSGAQVIGGVGNWSTRISGVSPEYLTVRDWELASGVFFTERQMRARAKVCVLGDTVSTALYPGADPVGQTLRIRNVPFTVIGVLARKGQAGGGWDQDDVILAPIDTVLYRLTGNRELNQIYASAVSSEAVTDAQTEIEGILRRHRRLGPGQDNDFNIRSQTEIVQAASSSMQTFTVLLGSIAGVSLLVGGIGIMNIMLVSVTERTREIGIRIAVGARRRDILSQFLVESIVLSMLGGLTGVALALGIAWSVERFNPEMRAIVDPRIVVLSLSVSMLIGIFFGLYPARRASLLDPIDALRHE